MFIGYEQVREDKIFSETLYHWRYYVVPGETYTVKVLEESGVYGGNLYTKDNPSHLLMPISCVSVSDSWNFESGSGTLTINGSGPMADYSPTDSPWSGLRQLIRSVVIEEGVTTVGDYAFYGCTSLGTLVIPYSVIYIGENAIEGKVYDEDGRAVVEPTAENLSGSALEKTGDGWIKHDLSWIENRYPTGSDAASVPDASLIYILAVVITAIIVSAAIMYVRTIRS